MALATVTVAAFLAALGEALTTSGAAVLRQPPPRPPTMPWPWSFIGLGAAPPPLEPLEPEEQEEEPEATEAFAAAAEEEEEEPEEEEEGEEEKGGEHIPAPPGRQQLDHDHGLAADLAGHPGPGPVRVRSSRAWGKSAPRHPAGPPVHFYLYDVPVFEPRFGGDDFSQCARKGADYMFLEALQNPQEASFHRVTDFRKAEVLVVPCLFETFRRCTSTNHAEKPPASLLGAGGGVADGTRREQAEAAPHPEDFEDVPWVKPFDEETSACLAKVMATAAFKERSASHFWVAADWSMNFGRTVEQTLFQNMTIGRIEGVDEREGAVGNRRLAVNQSKCSVVVPFASDVGYAEDFSRSPSFKEWWARPKAVSFRFEDRQYVLFCKGDPCEGAVDATPLRAQSLVFQEKLGIDSAIFMERVPLGAYADELHSSKFCLVVRGDTPSTHAFYDALAANCIPVLISDRWPALAQPFSRGSNGLFHGGFDFKSFTLTFSEDRWLNDIEGVVAEFRAILADKALCRSYFEAMQKGREWLLWSMPGNTVSSHMLRSARTCARSFS